MVRVWNFVLPDSGEHSLRVESVGTSMQRVWLDDVEVESRPGQTSFGGPGGALLRLKECVELKTPRATEKDARWTLLVNERMIEEVGQSGDGLRDLRNLPDGEYVIAHNFDAGSVVDTACRKFKFLVDGEQHEVAVAHYECVWQVSLDGKLVDQESHTLKENSGRAEFKVPAASGVQIPARLEMSWVLIEMKWAYHLQVGGVNVPAYWNKVKGLVPGCIPSIVSATAGALSEHPPVEAGPELVGNGENENPESLPQGVSYDKEAKTFQANIMDSKTKRYIFLGEFPSIEAAHMKYIDAMDKYAPDKKLAPALVA